MFKFWNRVKLPTGGPINYHHMPPLSVDKIKHAANELVDLEEYLGREFTDLFVHESQENRRDRVATYFHKMGELIILRGFLERFTHDEATAVLHGLDKGGTIDARQRKDVPNSVQIVRNAARPIDETTLEAEFVRDEMASVVPMPMGRKKTRK